MSSYLKFYNLEHSPFGDGAQSKVVLGTKALRDALAEIRSGLKEGATRICVNGRSGLGKTSLARALPKLLEEPTRIAVILDPTSSWDPIRKSIAKQWQVGDGGLARSNLVSFSDEARLVLVFDQAEKASTDILDHLDVMLSYRSEADEPVVQSVLFANLETRDDADPPPLIWWLDRIQTLELQFAPLPRDGVTSYIEKHLERAGWKSEALFDADAAHAIHGYTSGIPGEVDRVCKQLLREAAAQARIRIDASFVHEVLDDAVKDGDFIVVPVDDEPDPFENRFEALVHEDEFTGADTCSASAGPSRIQAENGTEDENDLAKHDLPESPVSTSEASVEDAADELERSPLELEAYLSRPPSADELREIRGRAFARPGRMAAALALAVALGSAAQIWINGGKSKPVALSDATAPVTASEIDGPRLDPTLFAGSEGLSTIESEPESLARLRGPLPQATPAAHVEPNRVDPKFDQGLPAGSHFFIPPPAAPDTLDLDSAPR